MSKILKNYYRFNYGIVKRLRNNWMFSDTEDGADASSMFYSLLCTAHVNDVKPFNLLKHLFYEIPKAKTIEDIENLADIIMGIKLIPEQ